MKRTCLFSQLLLVCVMFVICAGCNKGPRLYNVEGTVNVDGAPAEGVNLLFYKQGQSTACASGISKAGGALSTVTNGEPGIEIGEYEVAATYPDPSVKKDPTPGMGLAPIDPPDLFKGKYFKQKVQVQVNGKDKVTIDFKLK